MPQVFAVVITIDVEFLGLCRCVCLIGLRIVGLRLVILGSVGRKCHVESKLEGVVQHPRQILPQEGTRLLQTRVGIDFDEPWFQKFVYHEIVAEYLKA